MLQMLQDKRKINVLYWIFVNNITKHSVSQRRKQLPSPTLIQQGSIIPGKPRVTLVLGSGGLQLRTPPLEHLLKYGTQPRPEERLREHRMKLEFARRQRSDCPESLSLETFNELCIKLDFCL